MHGGKGNTTGLSKTFHNTSPSSTPDATHCLARFYLITLQHQQFLNYKLHCMPKTNSATKRSGAASRTSTGSKDSSASGTGSKTSSASRTGSKNSTGSKAQNGSGSRTNSGSRANSKASSRSKTQGASRSNSPVEDSKLKEFFIDELKDIYWAEQKLVKTLPKLAKAATSEELRSAFTSHLEETKGHVQRLEQAFKMLGEKATAKKCDAMEGITKEGSSVIDDTDEGTATRDVALVMAGQKAEHYEIATYGGLIQIARTMGHDDVAELLEQTLEEEKTADQKLTEIAEGGINYEASGEEED